MSEKENVSGEEVEVVAVFDGLYLTPLKSMWARTELIDKAQHQRITAAMAAEVERLRAELAKLRTGQEPSAVSDAVTMADVMRAWEYAEDHPHKYLRGTTNWCAAVAHSLNQRSPSAPATVQGDADNYRWLREQHNNVNSDIGVYDGANILATPEGDLDLDAAIAAARQEGGKV